MFFLNSKNLKVGLDLLMLNTMVPLENDFILKNVERNFNVANILYMRVDFPAMKLVMFSNKLRILGSGQ